MYTAGMASEVATLAPGLLIAAPSLLDTLAPLVGLLVRNQEAAA